jgi:hypothetical protein
LLSVFLLTGNITVRDFAALRENIISLSVLYSQLLVDDGLDGICDQYLRMPTIQTCIFANSFNEK